MAHLSSGELVDLAEGTRDAASAPHLRTCDRCQEELARLHEMMAAAAENDIPEPSPLFWEHFSERVRQATAGEPAPARPSFVSRYWPQLAGAACVAAVVLAVFTTINRDSVLPAAAIPPDPTPEVMFSPADDPALGLVADFGGTLEWDDLREQIGVSSRHGLDLVVGELDGGERRELERLLKEELARPAGKADRS
jgi:hypothetical protein